MQLNRTAFLILPFCLLLATVLCQIPAEAKVVLPSIFSDGMVIQREQSIVVWGKAAPAEQIQLTLAGQTRRASADAKGSWSTTFSALKPGPDVDLIVRSSNEIHIKNIKIGDVYLCSGQSNMALPLNQTDFRKEDIADLDKLNVRIYVTPVATSSSELFDPHGTWMTITDKSVRTFPAIPYLFARQLSLLEKLPVGIVSASCCGSYLESFLPPETVKRLHLQPTPLIPNTVIGNNFRVLLAPFCKARFAGMLWYQGEGNLLNTAQYGTHFSAFITDLRKRLEAPNLPFYFVQLPSFGWKQEDVIDSYWADMREEQSTAVALPNAYMVVSIDTDTDAPSLHPKEKREIALRLANLAFQKNKGAKIDRLPSIAKLQTEGDAITVSLNIPQGQLQTLDKMPPRGFQIAGENKRFYWAEATLSGNSIKLSCDEVAAPLAVRYAYADCPDCNVSYNGMPLPPFRTDTWPTNPKLNPAARTRAVAAQ
ncbi:MAG TPA: sialate O-acetylesterase [Oculatellaceae cyanobacterium]